jgi:hypothetical protein
MSNNNLFLTLLIFHFSYHVATDSFGKIYLNSCPKCRNNFFKTLPFGEVIIIYLKFHTHFFYCNYIAYLLIHNLFVYINIR